MTTPKTHYGKSAVTCPHCDHVYSLDEMNECQTDLWALASREETVDLECPVCDQVFFVRGGYQPHYTTAIAEELL